MSTTTTAPAADPTATTLPAVPKGHTRDYKLVSDAETGTPEALASVHTTPEGSHVDRWTSDKGWVSHGPTAVTVMGGGDTDSTVTDLDETSAQDQADARVGAPYSSFSVSPYICDEV